MNNTLCSYVSTLAIMASVLGAPAVHAIEQKPVSGLFRANTQITKESVRHKLPNAIVKLGDENLTASVAVKIDNLKPQDGFVHGEHDARLFWANVQYEGLKQPYGTSFKLGLLEPYDLSKAPLTQGFTHTLLDDAHILYGGIVAAKINQDINLGKNTDVSLNGGIGHKPDDWFERFGPKSDHVSFAGMNIKHKHDVHAIEAGYEYIQFRDDKNPSGADHFVYAKMQSQLTDKLAFNTYAEGVNGKRCKESKCKNTDRFSLSGSLTTQLSPSSDWEIAAGSIDGDFATETNAYYQLKDNNLKLTAGIGHNFDEDETALRLGALMPF